MQTAFLVPLVLKMEQKKNLANVEKSGRNWAESGSFAVFLFLALWFSAVLIACQLFINRFCLLENSFKTYGVFLFEICTAFFAAFIAFILPCCLKAAFIILSQLGFLLVFAVQICYFGVFSSFASLDALLRGTEALTNFGQIVKGTMIKNRVALIFMLCCFFAGLLAAFFYQRHSRKMKKTYISVLSAFCICVLLKAAGFVYVSATAALPNSPFLVFTQKCPINEQVAAVGVLQSVATDAKNLWLPENLQINKKILALGKDLFEKIPSKSEHIQLVADENLLKEFEASAAKNGTNGANGAAGENAAPESEYNILPIDFEKLLADDAGEEFHQIDRYFASIKGDKKNDHTGIFEGKNLIYITAESFSPYCIRSDLTPTLYKMLNEGYYFSHFYNPYWEISTTDGEYVNCTGLLPKLGTYSFKDSSKNYLPFALGNQFKKLGYTTKAYHNYLGSYYDRNLTHPNLGYDFYSMGEGYRTTAKWPDSDFEMMQETLKEYIDCQPFHAYYMTISGHLPYDFYANAMAIKNQGLVKDLDYDEAIKAFFACNIELDRALGYLLDTLNEYGIAENTVIALAADHWPYGLEPKQLRLISGKNLDVTFGLFESAFILFNPGQEREVVEKYCCNLDIIPTLSNLFGLPYDSRLLMGHDIFCDTEPFIVFKSTNVVTDRLKYNGSKGTALTHDGQNADPAEITAVKEKLQNQLKFSALVLDHDYYRRIFDSLAGENTGKMQN